MKTQTTLFAGAVLVAANAFAFPLHADSHAEAEVISILSQPAQTEKTMSLAEAMKRVAEEKQGHIISANIEEEDEMLHYEIEITQGKKVYEYYVNPLDGQIIEQELEFFETLENYFKSGKAMDERVNQQNVLFAAMSELEGQVLSVEMDEDDHANFYKVHSFNYGELQTQMLNAKSGEFIFYQTYRGQEDD